MAGRTLPAECRPHCELCADDTGSPAGGSGESAQPQSGGTLSDAQLAEANAAIKALTGRWGENSKWSGNAVQQWEGAKNNYFGSLFPQANNLFRGMKDIDTSNLIMLPMVDDSRTQVNSATDSDSSVIANPEESVALTNESLYDTEEEGLQI